MNPQNFYLIRMVTYRNQLHREMQTGHTRIRESIREHCVDGPQFGEHLGTRVDTWIRRLDDRG